MTHEAAACAASRGEDWTIVRSGVVLKPGAASRVWKTRFAVLRVREAAGSSSTSSNPFRGETVAAQLLLYAHAECGGPARRSIDLAGKKVRPLSAQEAAQCGPGCVVEDQSGVIMLRALTAADADAWLFALGDATRAPLKLVDIEEPASNYKTKAAASLAACAAAAAVSAGATMLLVAGVATGAGAVVAGAALVAERSVAKPPTKAKQQEIEATVCAKTDEDSVGVVSVTVRRARVVRSGGADDTLPPTLKIEGDDFLSATETQLESKLVVGVRCGDQAKWSRPMVRFGDLDGVDLSATFRIASVRSAVRVELRALAPGNDGVGALVAARSVSIFELLERDTERDIRRARAQLRALVLGHVADEEDSDDEPLDHYQFHKAPRPASSAPRRSSGEWYALLRPKKKEEGKEEDEETSEGHFFDGSCDDAGGYRSGAVGGLVEATLTLERNQIADSLRPKRAELDRPSKDTSPTPSQILGYLKRGIAVVTWAAGLSNKIDALLRWDDFYESLFAVSLIVVSVLLWARDHCFALPPFFSLVGLLALGYDRYSGVWHTRRVALVVKDDDDATAGDDDLARCKWRLSHPRNARTLTFSLPELRISGLDDQSEGDAVVVVKYVPAAAQMPAAKRALAAAYVISEADTAQSPAATDIRDAIGAALDVVADRQDDAMLRAFKMGSAVFEFHDGIYTPKQHRSLSRASAPTAEVSVDDDDTLSVSSSIRGRGDLATVAPARVGIGSRAQYEAERFIRWTSRLVARGGNADEEDGAASEKGTKVSVGAAVADRHHRVRSGLDDPRRCRQPDDDRAKRATTWTLPVLEELERDPGGNRFTPAVKTAWRHARGAVRVEIYLPDDKEPRPTCRQVVTRQDATRAVHALTYGDRRSPFYHSRNSKDDDDDALGLAPRPDMRLAGVATIPLSRLGRGPDARWLEAPPPIVDDGAPPTRIKVRVEARLDADWEATGVSLARWKALDTLEAALELPDTRTRCFVERCRSPKTTCVDVVDVAPPPTEVPPSPSTKDDDEGVEEESSRDDALAEDEAKGALLAAEGSGGGGGGGGFQFLERFRRARKSAVEMQNSLHDAVRSLEQFRALVEWAHPRATSIVVVGLVLATYVAARARADYVGLLAVAGAFGPGLVDRFARRGASRTVPRAKLLSLADRCASAAAKARRDEPLAACASAAAEALRILASSLGVTYAAAERLRDTTSAKTPPKPALWKSVIASLLEGLPAEPDLDAAFADRRRAAEWRRERRAVAHALGASWVGPLWRRSTAWRRHFAAVRHNKQLCFWYSPKHALAGVSPVLVVSLRNAALVAPQLPHPGGRLNRGDSEAIDAFARDGLRSIEYANEHPVLTLHAATLAAPDKLREWRLAAAHYRDAAQLRQCIEDQANSDSEDDDDDDDPAKRRLPPVDDDGDEGDQLPLTHGDADHAPPSTPPIEEKNVARIGEIVRGYSRQASSPVSAGSAEES